MSLTADAEALRERFSDYWKESRIVEIGDFFYADQAMLLPPDRAPVHGRAAIVAFLQGLREQVGVGAFGVLRTCTDGDLAYIAGTAEFPDAELELTTLETYQREHDGSWKCVVDMFHSSRPPST